MRALLDIILQIKHWLVFLLLETISLVFLFSSNGHQRNVFFTTANDVVGSTYNVISYVTSYMHLRTENRLLEAQNEHLRRQVYMMRQQLEASKADKEEPSIDVKGYGLVNAQVVNMTLHKPNNLITINKGEADGIRPEMGVVCSQGVVGVVYMTSPHYSLVMPILNVNSKISCRLRKSEYFGSLRWTPDNAKSLRTASKEPADSQESTCGQPTNTAYVASIPRHAKVHKNDIVETNGFSDIFPPGLPIGRVNKIGDSDDGIAYLLRITLFTYFPTLREVTVITGYRSDERRTLEAQANSPELGNVKQKERKEPTR